MYGGESKEYGYTISVIDPLNVGDEYLLFLYRPESGGGIEIKDGHYYIKSPADGYSYRDTTLENLKANQESGFFSQEEYNQYLREFEQYAKIVDNYDVQSLKPKN